MSTEKNNGPSEESETINKLKSAVNALAMIIQDHIPNANLTPVLSNLNLEVPGIGSSSHNNSLSVNQISSLRSQNDNDNLLICNYVEVLYGCAYVVS
ncbi:hypothetical protein R6Q57_027680 [Mikania cordata]